MKEPSLKRFMSAFLAVLMMIFTMAGNPKYTKNAVAADDYHSWTQMDSRWGSVSMGYSSVAKSGCLITAISIMAMHSESLDSKALSNLGISSTSQFNPGVLAKAYTAKSGFTSDGAIASWGTLNQIIPNISFIKDSNLTSWSQSGVASELKAMLDSGTHVILNANGYHWVYIEAVVGDKVYMNDPGSDSTDLFAKYGVSGGNEYWALKGSKAPYYSGGTTTTTTTTTTVVTTTTTETTTTTTESATTTTTTEPICVGLTTESTTTSVTTTTTVTTTATVADEFDAGEYVNLSGKTVEIHTLPNGNGSLLASVEEGDVISIIFVNQSQGVASFGETYGWTDISQLTYIEEEADYETGDINNDGNVDKYDLALLNEYLSSRNYKPEGISRLRANALKAADVNGDGIVSKSDVQMFIMLICN